MLNTTVSLDDKYALTATRAYMSGIEALVRLPMLQRQRDLERGHNTAGLVSGYRGSPLGGLDQALWKAKPFLDQHNVTFLPGVNEDLAATAVWGSQQVNLFEGARYDGVFGMWYGKGPGVDRSMDVIRHANAFGTSPLGGVLAVAGDDHAAKSSSLPHQSEHMFIGVSMPVLNPASVQEVLDLGIYGWELSRYCGAWVALKAITENMDSAISASIDPNRVNIRIPDAFELPADGVHARWPDNALDQERRLNKFKIYAAREFARVNQLNRIVINSDRPRLGIITTGKAYLDVMQALEDLGIDERRAGALRLRVLKVGMSWPLEPVSTHAFAEGLEEILVIEEKRSIIEDQLTSHLYNWPVSKRPRVIGEFDEDGRDLLPNLSELTPARVARAIAGRLGRYHQDAQIASRLAFYDRKEAALAQPRASLERTPHYCSGCPHSRSTRIPAGSRALGGIGCHYMGTWEEGDRRAETFTQMGGEGVTWVGQAPFTKTPHVFQNLGDGTYFHSGLLAIRQAIAAKTTITYKILYNDAVAMTGGQPVDGVLSVEQMIMQLRGEGVRRIAVVSDNPNQYQLTPLPDGVSIDSRDALLNVEEELRDTRGTTVLIYHQMCAAERRRQRKRGQLPDPARRVVINPEVCEGCGDCGTASNCLSVVPLETELGRKRRIDQSACNKDFSCLDGFCPSFVTVEGGSLARPAAVTGDAGFGELPMPAVAPTQHRPWNMLVTGIGGTGVLTVSAIVAMAAHIEGKGCATMNQTGLAQKFGAVVSHVRIGQCQDDIKAVRIAAGDADLLLGCDLVVAAGDEALAKVHAERSHAVINDAETVTAEFINNRDARFPGADMRATIDAELAPGRTHHINGTDIATGLTGDSIAANFFLLGYAAQQGLVPVSIDAIDAAISLNGVAVEMNRSAFLWGRRAAVDLDAVKNHARLAPRFTPLHDVDAIVADRYARLVTYQDRAYADRYKAAVERIRTLEHSFENEKETLTRAVARNLYRLMAIKDEYEVARLFTNGTFEQQLGTMFEGDYKLNYHLAPPSLTGAEPHKRAFPQATRRLFQVLRHLKFLRGTQLDPFGWSTDRRDERALLADYEAMLERIEARLSARTYEVAVALASIPEEIRGFGHIKRASMEAAAPHRRDLMRRLEVRLVDAVQVFEAA